MIFKKIFSLLLGTLLPAYEKFSSLLWLFLLYPVYFLHLKALGFSDIKLFEFKNWHLSCRYLVAVQNNRRVFIKCGRSFLIENEIIAGTRLARINSNHVVKIINYKISKFKFINFIITEFLDDYFSLENLDYLSLNQLQHITAELEQLIAEFDKVKIVHRDLSLKNIFIHKSDRNRIKVIDFAMASGKGLKAMRFFLLNRLVKNSLGHNYRPAKNIWNDSYSVRKILKELEQKIPWDKKNDKCINC